MIVIEPKTNNVLPTHVGVILVLINTGDVKDGTTHTRGGDPEIYQVVAL